MNTIMTPCGEIRGCACQWDGVVAYKGIRYAIAKRFEYAEAVTSWDGVYEADHYGNCSYQPRAFYNEEDNPGKIFYYNEFRKGETYTYDDDCLFLNIWAPEDAKDLPVLFYIHGGGFTGGCGHEKHFDGPVWATKGVIAVTINYRLGPVGFMCLPELKEKDGHTGNYAMYDQLTALQWVRDNIKAFGGNPEKITIMGQSAGAMSVQTLCLSPMAKGKFRAAVMSSGCGVNKMMSNTRSEEDNFEFWTKVKEEASCKTIEELQELPAEKLFAAWDKVKKESKNTMAYVSPCVDHGIVSDKALKVYEEGGQHNIPYLIGVNSQDIVPAIFFKMSTSWCARQSKLGRKDCFAYFFDRQLPGDDRGAWHSADLWYWFGTLKNGWRPFEEKDEKLSNMMSDYLVQFVKTGNPNKEGLRTWEPYGKAGQVMLMGEKPAKMGKPNKLALLKTTLTTKPVGE